MADTTKSIKEATDKELDDIINRLRKENEVQDLIGNLKRKSSEGYVSYDQQQGISTEKPIDSMYHFGIPGMHWGHRNSRQPTTVIRTTNSEDHIKKTMLKGKKISEMTNAELKAYNERVMLEKQYKNLSKAEISPGKKFVQNIVTTQGTNMINRFLTAHTNKLVDDLISKTIKE